MGAATRRLSGLARATAAANKISSTPKPTEPAEALSNKLRFLKRREQAEANEMGNLPLVEGSELYFNWKASEVAAPGEGARVIIFQPTRYRSSESTLSRRRNSSNFSLIILANAGFGVGGSGQVTAGRLATSRSTPIERDCGSSTTDHETR